MTGTLIVTGGSRGIGAAICKLAAEKGYDVVVNFAKNHQAAQNVVQAIEAVGQRAIAINADMCVADEINQLFEVAHNTLGNIVGLINNAGIVAQSLPVSKMDAQRLELMMQTNVVAPFLCAKHAIPYMSTAHGGAGGNIINIGSIAARIASPNQYVDYAASKAALDTFTKGLALELADQNIRVNCVRPGIIDTEIHASGGEPDRVARVGHQLPMGRAGTAVEVANAVMWLLSDEASYCTGTILDVSGGR